ncbi:putative membrane protein [Paraburkholderia sp. GAS333]|uniref:periplasmic heavy metal sensor n=1 Tax=Paraburkholderia sp. GAS333 TaxID=3156279 RepID=UPI003D1D0127
MNGRSWKIVLAVSLVLNVFLLGAIAGGAYQWFAAHRANTPAQVLAQQRALRFAAQPLSAEKQQAFIDGLKDARRDGRQFAREGREGRREVLRLLAAPQLDRAALDAALARTRAADSNLRAKVEGSVADFAATLSPEERVEFADSLKLRGQWRETVPAANAKAQARKQASSETSGE